MKKKTEVKKATISEAVTKAAAAISPIGYDSSRRIELRIDGRRHPVEEFQQMQNYLQEQIARTYGMPRGEMERLIEREEDRRSRFQHSVIIDDPMPVYGVDFGRLEGLWNSTINRLKKDEIQSAPVPVEEIHAVFFGEMDKLLAEAKIMKPVVVSPVLQKAARLQALGFEEAKEVKKVKAQLDANTAAEKENEEKKFLAEAIEYFKAKYPLYKFITLESIEKICNKYGLVHGLIYRYKGTIPEKNLLEMENFKIHEEDECYLDETVKEDMGGFGSTTQKTTYFHKDSSEAGLKNLKKASLMIAAPEHDFEMKGMEKRGNRLVYDPVVFHQVMYKGKRVGALICTAWGEEANDPLVQNEKMN